MWWKFFAGGAIGAFFTHLFGGSHSATASSHTDRIEHFHNTMIYDDDDDDSDFCYGDADTFHDSDEWDANDGSFNDDFGDYDDYDDE